MSASFFTEGPEGDQIAAAAALARAWAISEGYPDAENDPGKLSSRAYALLAETSLNTALAGAEAAQAGAEAAQTAAEEAQAAAEAAAASIGAFVIETPFTMFLSAGDTEPYLGSNGATFAIQPSQVVKLHLGLLQEQSDGDPLEATYSVNDVVIGTLTLPNGQKTVSQTLVSPVSVAGDDIIKVELTATGIGGLGARASFVLRAV